MPSFVRLVLVWLMVLAIPVQGFAAAAMQHCGPTHEQMRGVSSTASAGDGHAHVHAGQTDAGSSHSASPEPAAAQPSSALPDDIAADAGVTCSACAGCCVALGIPAATVRLPAAPIGVAAVDRSPTQRESFVPAGLDRPPRAVLA